MTPAQEAAESSQQLTEKLLAFMEVEAGGWPGIEVVERRQLDLAMHELVLTGLRDEPGRLRLGSLVNAELIVTAKAVPGDQQGSRFLSVRVTESLTGVIRGGVEVPLDPLELEETAHEVLGFLAAVIETPDLSTATIAVLPLDSLGQFDRLRPLERGLRDIMVSHLRERGGIRVLQRSELTDLIAEIDLVRGGFVSPESLPKTLPSRAASWLLSGTLDERQDGTKRRVTVKLQLVSAATRKPVAEAEVTASPATLAGGLIEEIDRLIEANRLAEPRADNPDAPKPDEHEINTLYELAVQDLLRTSRKNPRDFSERSFVPPGKQWQRGKLVTEPPRELGGRLFRQHIHQANPQGGHVRASTPLGESLIRKAIDRLESVVYLQPNHRLAQYALAWCYSFHLEGIHRPGRARELLLKVYDSDTQGEQGAAALDLLTERHFHHQTGFLAQSFGDTPPADGSNKEQRLEAWDDTLFALTKMPSVFRENFWSRLSYKLSGILARRELDDERRLAVVRAHVQLVEGGDRVLLPSAMRLLQRFAKAEDFPAARAEALAALSRWQKDESPQMQAADLTRRAQEASSKQDYRLAADLYKQLAAVHAAAEPQTSVRVRQHNVAMRDAASCLRRGGEPRKALALLESFKPSDHRAHGLVRGYYGFELGQCLEAVGKKSEALRVYLAYAESDESIVNNSAIEERIVARGGAPLNPDRKIDIEYVRDDSGKEAHYGILATDGKRLFLAQGYFSGRYRGVTVFDPQSKAWRVLPGMEHPVTTLACSSDRLWVGTKTNGLWSCDLASETWESWGADRGLPDNRIVDVCLHGEMAYASVGERTAGGVVRIDPRGEIKVYNDGDAPRVCLYYLTSDGHSLWGVNRFLHRLDLAKSTWEAIPDPKRKGRSLYTLFAHSDQSGLWLSRPKQEVFRLNATEQDNQLYKAAWYVRKFNTKSGYTLRFASERGGYLWFGGEPWRRLLSSGLYRINLETGEYDRFGPRDGFKIGGRGNTYRCSDGVWIGEQLWVASSSGLVKVTPRP